MLLLRLSGLTCATPARSQGRSAGPYQNPRLMLLLRNVQITNQFGTVNLVVWADLCHSSPIARKIRRPISESAADVAAQIRWLGGSAGPYQNPRLMLLLRNVQITNQFGTVNLVVWPDLCHCSQIARKIRRPISESAADVAAQKCPNYEPIWHARLQGRSAGPYQNPRLMLLLRVGAIDLVAHILEQNVQITNQFGTVNLVVWADLCHCSQIARKIRRPISESVADVAAQKCPNYEPIWHARSQGRSAGPYQNPRLMLLPRNVQITNQFGTCHSSQIARKIRRPISESAADVAAQTRSQGRSAGPYRNPWLMLLLRNVQTTNQFGTVNLVVWADLCHSSPIARKIRRPISESAADVAAQKCPNYEPIWHVRWLGGSAGPYQNPQLMLLLRNVQITNQFGTVNLVVWADLCHSSPIARKIRRPISESAADVAAQSGCNGPGYPYFGTECPNYEPIWHARSQGRSAGPYQNPWLMLLLRNVQTTNQFGTVNLVVWPDLCHSSPIARKIRRPISESAADVAAQTRSQGRSAGPYQNPRLMLLPRNVQITNQFGTVNLVVWADLCHCSQIARKIRRPISESVADVAAQKQNVQITNQFGTVNLVVWADLCHSSPIARKIRRPISESAADVAAQTRSQGRSAGPYQNPRLMLLPRNVQITNQFGTVNLVVWADLCHCSQIARKIRRPISESVADVAAQKQNVQITNQFGTVNLVVWADLCHSSPIARKIRRPISESAADVAAQTRSQGRSAGPYQNPRLMLLPRNVQITNQFGTVNLVVWADLCHSSPIARKIRRPISESAADVAAQKCPNYEPIWHVRWLGGSAGPYQNPRLMLLLRNVQITNQFGTVNLVVWPDLCHSSPIARKIRRPISESAADVAAQTRSQGRFAGPYQNPRLMLLLRNVQITNQFGTVNLVVWADLCHCSQIARKIRRSISECVADVAAQKQNVQITNQFGTVNLVVWPDLCHCSQIARKIRQPISESAADVAAQTRSQGRSAGPYQNPRLMLLPRNVQITNQFGMVNLVVWADLCHSSPIARKIRRPISESAADVAAQIRWLGGSAGPYQNPRLMLLLRLSGPTCATRAPTSQMARRIRRPISESAADVAAQIRWLGGSTGPYQNLQLMLLLRNVQITNQFGTVNLVVWADLCHSSQIARTIHRPISESAADVAAQTRSQGRSTGPYQNPRLMLLPRNVQITNQFGMVNLVVWADLCHSSPIARKIRRPISESAADVAAQKCPNYEPIWHVRWLGGSAGPYQNPRLMLLLRLSGPTCATRAPTSQMARRIRRPISESAADVAAQIRWLGGSTGPYQNLQLMLLLRNVQITNQFGTVNLVVWADLCHSSQIARTIHRPISESAADVAAQIVWADLGQTSPNQSDGWEDPPAHIRIRR
ncbi:hypothetical protein GGX14DRAFT_401478 [Mycena pura]|uniref:Uncharacterized protein n=1 Tax=Mycena pura TaxID=153505 RepID=A0AAD6V414_9AGAR|nr:hypothetical protein GGX14DRAFT_401478 [Mycena pura]